MPAFWTSEDTKNAVLATLLPAGIAAAGVGAYIQDKKAAGWWESLRKPKWITGKSLKCVSGVDVVAGLPIGYASYLCYKHGGGFDYNDTRLALALYGVNLASVAACVPLVKKHNLNCLYRNMYIVSGSAVAAAVAFYKIHKPAGYWFLPYAVWTAFYLYLVRSIVKENEPVKDI